ncbi:hypothetical protein [Aquimarina macrocephali]|uniref:hypothetical protein n=1 Tax=Aquimarina macrocephali TaxID=666563 RepID=UPI003F66170F
MAIIFFQVQKKNQYKKDIEENTRAKELANSEFVKLLDQRPIYGDSIYKIYIAKFGEHTKIVFLRKGSISEIQKESRFFLHLYPRDKTLLGESESKSPSFDFKNNVSSFTFKQSKYFVSSTNLPDIMIDKINVGQYGYRGDSKITWQISSLLSAESIEEILKINKEENNIFKRR